MTLFALLLATCGQLSLDVKPTYKAGEPIVFAVKGAGEKAAVQWELAEGLAQLPAAEKQAIHVWGKTGTYACRCYVIDWDAKTFLIKPFSVRVEDGSAPVPPGPSPTPDPPGPTPTPPPIPGDGLRVLIRYESGELQKVPATMTGVLYSMRLRTYLDSVCAMGPDGKTREWRIFDKDVDVSGESPTWQAAMKRPQQTNWWITISNGKTGFEGALPTNVDDTIALIKRYEVR